MADCLKRGDGKGEFTNMDGTEGAVQAQMHPAPAAGRRQGGALGACTLAYLAFISFVAIVAFILGCYSTNRVRTLSYPDALLVSDPTVPPGPGYSVFSLGTGLGYWTPSADMLFPRSDHGVIAYGKWAYLVGGLSVDPKNPTSGPTILDAVVRYDTETGTMEIMKSLLGRRSRFAYALLGDEIYVIGGVQATFPDDSPLKTVLVYNITTGDWRYGAQLTAPRVDACAAAANGKIYVTGGYDAAFVSLATVEEFDPATGLWTALPESSNMATSRGDCRAVAVGGHVYAMGGAEYYNNPTANCSENWVWCYRFLNSVEAFDPIAKKWTSRAPMINARGDFGIDALPGGRIIVAGGERGNGTQNQIALYDVEEYIVQDNVWIAKAPLPQARFRADMAYAAGRVYTFGGAPSCALTGGDDSAPDACFRVALSTVFALYDQQYPRLFAFYKDSSVAASTDAVAGRRMLL